MAKRGPVPKNKLPTSPSTVAVSPYALSGPRRTKEDEERERRYKAEEALRTIQRAEEHRRDGKLMKDVKMLAREQMDGLKNITGKKDRDRDDD